MRGGGTKGHVKWKKRSGERNQPLIKSNGDKMAEQTKQEMEEEKEEGGGGEEEERM